MDLHQRRIEVLRRVEAGELSPEEGSRLLLGLEQVAASGPAPDAGLLEDVQPWQPAVKVQTVTVSDGAPAAAAIALPAPAAASAQAGQSAGPTDGTPESGWAQSQAQETTQAAAPGPQARRVSGWRGLWLLPLLLGLFLTLVSINWMYLGLATAGLSWGFWLSFFPFALGVLLMWAGWELNGARWLHVRIRQRPGAHPEKLDFSIPLPLGLTRWVVRKFGRFSPQVNGKDVSDFLDEIDRATAQDGAMHLFVDDPDGSEVEVWIES